MVVHGFPKKHTICHVLEYCVWARDVLEPNAISYFLSKLHIQFIRYSLCHGHRSYTARLRTCDKLSMKMWKVIKKDKLRDLRSFTRASLTNENKDLIFMEKIKEFLSKSLC
jgi:hypothetical protein